MQTKVYEFVTGQGKQFLKSILKVSYPEGEGFPGRTTAACKACRLLVESKPMQGRIGAKIKKSRKKSVKKSPKNLNVGGSKPVELPIQTQMCALGAHFKCI